MLNEMNRRLDDLFEVVRWDLRGHADGNAIGAVDEEIRESRRRTVGSCFDSS
jgi:hypothetical protein